MRARRGLLAGAGFGALALAACSLLVPLDDAQCASDADCAARGGPFAGAVCVNKACVAPSSIVDGGNGDAGDGGTDAAPDTGPRDPWRCLADPPQTLDPNARVDLSVLVLNALAPIVTNGVNGGSDLDVLSGTVLPGVSVTACNTLDTSCTHPVGSTRLTDDAGIAHFTVPGDFAGYFSLGRTDPVDAAANIFPSTVFPGHLLAGVATQGEPMPLIDVYDTQQLALILGVPLATDPDGGLGHAFFLIYDCDDRHAPDVKFSIGDAGSDSSVFWYVANGYPSPTATQTDSLGTGGVINIPSGLLDVSAREADGGRELGRATVFIRSGGTTFAWIRLRTR